MIKAKSLTGALPDFGNAGIQAIAGLTSYWSLICALVRQIHRSVWCKSSLYMTTNKKWQCMYSNTYMQSLNLRSLYFSKFISDTLGGSFLSSVRKLESLFYSHLLWSVDLKSILQLIVCCAPMKRLSSPHRHGDIQTEGRSARGIMVHLRTICEEQRWYGIVRGHKDWSIELKGCFFLLSPNITTFHTTSVLTTRILSWASSTNQGNHLISSGKQSYFPNEVDKLPFHRRPENTIRCYDIYPYAFW